MSLAKAFSLFLTLILTSLVVYIAGNSKDLLEVLPTGQYEIMGTGCLNKDEFTPFTPDFYKFYIAENYPQVSLYFLDFEKTENRVLEVGTNYLTLKMEANDCQVEAHYKILSNRNRQLILDRSYSLKIEPSNCSLEREALRKVMRIDSKFLREQGLIISNENGTEVKVKMKKLGETYHFLLDTKDYMTYTPIPEIADYAFEELGVEEDFEVCNPSKRVSWKLKRTN